ncbi:hypothetical protein EJ05DRAFT_515279 [Pseudovirgaria hyperparasitica]|uniref:Uncharacterized protein n=1 Tax=Pseudovirgaria hyperparasitica TaxID=470096 RepID=A0A6A6VS06_9PEZI|nr:uncharacterized protein EJ05DRAFT_515279 [Pseudovirgaria hyperparasitica]KAF2752983.1 hypothetical protein EJ05DRAFT_515279 [Pseudovirgaria hyperparasitica]
MPTVSSIEPPDPEFYLVRPHHWTKESLLLGFQLDEILWENHYLKIGKQFLQGTTEEQLQENFYQLLPEAVKNGDDHIRENWLRAGIRVHVKRIMKKPKKSFTRAKNSKISGSARATSSPNSRSPSPQPRRHATRGNTRNNTAPPDPTISTSFHKRIQACASAARARKSNSSAPRARRHVDRASSPEVSRRQHAPTLDDIREETDILDSELGKSRAYQSKGPYLSSDEDVSYESSSSDDESLDGEDTRSKCEELSKELELNNIEEDSALELTDLGGGEEDTGVELPDFGGGHEDNGSGLANSFEPEDPLEPHCVERNENSHSAANGATTAPAQNPSNACVIDPMAGVNHHKRKRSDASAPDSSRDPPRKRLQSGLRNETTAPHSETDNPMGRQNGVTNCIIQKSTKKDVGSTAALIAIEKLFPMPDRKDCEDTCLTRVKELLQHGHTELGSRRETHQATVKELEACSLLELSCKQEKAKADSKISKLSKKISRFAKELERLGDNDIAVADSDVPDSSEDDSDCELLNGRYKLAEKLRSRLNEKSKIQAVQKKEAEKLSTELAVVKAKCESLAAKEEDERTQYTYLKVELSKAKEYYITELNNAIAFCNTLDVDSEDEVLDKAPVSVDVVSIGV